MFHFHSWCIKEFIVAQVTIIGLQLNAYIMHGTIEVVTKNDKIKLVNLVYFNCTMEAQRDEELFVESFNSKVIEGYGLIDPEEGIKVVKWTADKKEFDALSNEFYHLQNKMVEEALS